MYIAGFRYRGLTMAVPANVLALGMVSLVTDVSSEMVTAVLPYYAVLVLGLSPLAYGLLDGLYFGVTAVVRLAAGHAADRWQRRKLVAGLGYALSAVCKLGLMAAGGSVGLLGAVVAADRTGKGLRTAPRDALISLSAAPETQGQAFGVHRAMDTVGAFLGPLAAFAVLGATGAYDVVFVVSFAIAVFGVVLLVLYVREQPSAVTPVPRVRPRVGLALLREPRFRRICLLAAALGLVTVSDPFVYLLLQKGTGIAPEHFPLLPLGTAAVYLLLAVPVGRLADRWGRIPVFMLGHLALVGVYALLGGGAPYWLVLAMFGLFYAATDGVLMAAAGPLLPAHLRTSGLALLQTGQAVARMLSSIMYGAAWTFFGPVPGLVVMGAGIVACLGFWKVVR
ncbi:MFS transporter [Nonomuraea africana]|uniref:MFS family permease n=1 Tax=Nonomuraea africana TaxID=46171 RepID=A0ABR9KCF4_9ACTN|nr:MFS transporter [Nonomuraea africana]MBE1559393.1 MFS family permease [Nonomuraea africana]